jgi:hypothetical protein
MYPPVRQLGSTAQIAAERRRMEFRGEDRERRDRERAGPGREGATETGEPASGCRRAWTAAVAASLTASVATVYLVATAVSSAAPIGGGSGCTPGVRTIGGVQARVFCGPAKATAQIASKSFRFVNGSCERRSGFTLNIRTIAGGAGSSRPYFGLDVLGNHAGTYRNGAAVVSFHTAKHRFSISPSTSTVVLAPGLGAGTFSGLDLLGRSVRGTFTC